MEQTRTSPEQSAIADVQSGHAPGEWGFVPGLVVCGGIGGIAIQLGRANWLQGHGMSALTIAIVLGILLGNTFYRRVEVMSEPGVSFAKHALLRLGVILYGFRLTFHDVAQVGVEAALIDALLVSSTFALALILGTRYFGLDRTTAVLVGAGSAICGAAAIMATEPLLRGKAEQVTAAVSTVVIFGTLAIFVYPLLYDLNLQWHVLPPGSRAFGIYVGSTVHEVAQVFAAGRSISGAVADTAVITKMLRVMMLAPFLLALSAYLALERQPANSSAPGATTSKLRIPWFALAFIGVVIFNSFDLLPRPVVTAATDTDTLLLCMAMAALGLATNLSAIRRAGARPLLLGAVLAIWLVAGGALINAIAGWR